MPAHLITVAASKGGAGKSTTAVCLAWRLALLHGPANVRLLDLDPQATAASWLPDLAVSTRATDSGTIRQLSDRQFTVCDVPPGESRALAAALEEADLLLGVTALDPGDLKALGQLINLVDLDLLLPTRLDARRSVHADSLRRLHSRFGRILCEPIPEAAEIGWAHAEGRPLRSGSRPALAYAELANRVLAALSVGA